MEPFYPVVKIFRPLGNSIAPVKLTKIRRDANITIISLDPAVNRRAASIPGALIRVTKVQGASTVIHPDRRVVV
jgi:hypothetical protein